MVACDRLDDVQVSDAEFAQLTGGIAERRRRVAVVHVVEAAEGRQADADALLAPNPDHGLGDFQQQPGAVLHRAAVLIRARVRAVAQELIRQVAVRAVDLHAVKPGGLGVPGAVHVLLHDAGDFGQFQGARGHVLLAVELLPAGLTADGPTGSALSGCTD